MEWQSNLDPRFSLDLFPTYTDHHSCSKQSENTNVNKTSSFDIDFISKCLSTKLGTEEIHSYAVTLHKACKQLKS